MDITKQTTPESEFTQLGIYSSQENEDILKDIFVGNLGDEADPLYFPVQNDNQSQILEDLFALPENNICSQTASQTDLNQLLPNFDASGEHISIPAIPDITLNSSELMISPEETSPMTITPLDETLFKNSFSPAEITGILPSKTSDIFMGAPLFQEDEFSGVKAPTKKRQKILSDQISTLSSGNIESINPMTQKQQKKQNNKLKKKKSTKKKKKDMSEEELKERKQQQLQKRLLKNRRTADISRKRRKAKKQMLEESLEQLKIQEKELQMQSIGLLAENKVLTSEYKALLSMIKSTPKLASMFDTVTNMAVSQHPEKLFTTKDLAAASSVYMLSMLFALHKSWTNLNSANKANISHSSLQTSGEISVI